jgi:Preprotein translocase subunit Sec61beta
LAWAWLSNILTAVEEVKLKYQPVVGHMARRRRGDLNLFTAAGLLNFSREGEIEKIKLNPKTVVIASMVLMGIVIILNLLRI